MKGDDRAGISLLALGPVFVLALLAELAWPAALRVGGLRPDLLVLFLLHVSLILPERHVLPLAFGLGICRDLLCGTGLGPGALCFVLGARLVLGLRRAIHREKWVPRMLGALALGLAVETLAAVRFWLWGYEVNWGRAWTASLYTAAVAPAVMGAFDLFAETLARRRREAPKPLEVP